MVGRVEPFVKHINEQLSLMQTTKQGVDALRPLVPRSGFRVLIRLSRSFYPLRSRDKRVEFRCLPLPLRGLSSATSPGSLHVRHGRCVRGLLDCSPAHDHVTTAEGEPPERLTRGLVYVL